MIVKLLTEHHLEFLSSKGGCRGSSESTLVRMLNCWKSRALAHLVEKFQVQEPILRPGNLYNFAQVHFLSLFFCECGSIIERSYMYAL